MDDILEKLHSASLICGSMDYYALEDTLLELLNAMQSVRDGKMSLLEFAAKYRLTAAGSTSGSKTKSVP